MGNNIQTNDGMGGGVSTLNNLVKGTRNFPEFCQLAAKHCTTANCMYCFYTHKTVDGRIAHLPESHFKVCKTVNKIWKKHRYGPNSTYLQRGGENNRKNKRERKRLMRLQAQKEKERQEKLERRQKNRKGRNRGKNKGEVSLQDSGGVLNKKKPVSQLKSDPNANPKANPKPKKELSRIERYGVLDKKRRNRQNYNNTQKQFIKLNARYESVKLNFEQTTSADQRKVLEGLLKRYRQALDELTN